MQTKRLLLILIFTSILVLTGCAGQIITPTPGGEVPQQVPVLEQTAAQPAPAAVIVAAEGMYDPEQALEGFKAGGCASCHIIPGVPGASGVLGPDLSRIGEVAAERVADKKYTGKAKTVTEYMVEALLDPEAYIAPDCNGNPCQKGLMPASLAEAMSGTQQEAVINYLAALPDYEQAAIQPEAPAQSTPEEPTQNTPEAQAQSASQAGIKAVSEETELLGQADFDWSKQVYFERCAGCHGTLRKGATGPGLTPDLTTPKGTLALAAIIFNGTNGGMPDWGVQGFFTKEETDVMAKFLQMEPPIPPEMSLSQMLDTWKVLIPPEERPTEPQTTRDWENYFSVTLRDAGQVAIIDGDTHEVVKKVDSGYAVHITRMSATGRYAYVIGRDGRLAMIDLWMEEPDKVAEVQLCYDARSVEVSKYEGELGNYKDKYAVVGCYWPPHFVILDGQTLEPFKIVSTRSYTYDTEEYHPEPRVASILASHFKPEWVINVKETGQSWLVNYTDPDNPDIKMIETELFLHDGGLDASKRYFIVAANNSNRVAVIDLQDGNLEALVDTLAIPHPGRGANWIDPEFGAVWSTSHLGDAGIVSIGTDPDGKPENAWKVVRDTPLPGSGSLFLKTHPNSKWVWVDMTLNPDPVLSRTVCVIEKANPAQVHKCWEAASYGRAVHFEYNRQGTEIWVSIWGDAKIAGEEGEIVIYDDATLEEIDRIPGLVTPTGKFNVYNTVQDVY